MKSILQSEKECYITGAKEGLHLHHIYGASNRKASDKNGFVIWLRSDWHNMSEYGIHFDKEFDLKIKMECQARYEETHTRKEFISLIGRSYL